MSIKDPSASLGKRNISSPISSPTTILSVSALGARTINKSLGIMSKLSAGPGVP